MNTTGCTQPDRYEVISRNSAIIEGPFGVQGVKVVKEFLANEFNL